ncbi:MAG: hypothetical protein ACLP8S_17785 [Solirubrobacteraceae bacterium]
MEWLSAIAYSMHMNVGFVGYKTTTRQPIIVLTPLPNGWQILPQHIPARTRCAGLNAE